MKKFDISLYKSLIESDFLLINSNKIGINFIKKKYSYTLFENKNFLNSLLTIKHLKQFINLLRFIKQKKGTIHIISEKIETKLLIKSSNLKSIRINYFSEIIKLKDNNQQKLLLNLEAFLNNNLMYRLFINRFFLIQNIALRFNNDWGSYNLFNDLFDFKKIIFLIILINKV